MQTFMTLNLGFHALEEDTFVQRVKYSKNLHNSWNKLFYFILMLHTSLVIMIIGIVVVSVVVIIIIIPY